MPFFWNLRSLSRAIFCIRTRLSPSANFAHCKMSDQRYPEEPVPAISAWEPISFCSSWQHLMAVSTPHIFATLIASAKSSGTSLSSLRYGCNRFSIVLQKCNCSVRARPHRSNMSATWGTSFSRMSLPSTGCHTFRSAAYLHVLRYTPSTYTNCACAITRRPVNNRCPMTSIPMRLTPARVAYFPDSSKPAKRSSNESSVKRT
mmetsp:Transcript_5106/g.12235  ORF Transcript_5106/g.12235 Transcript_5106/m.12235 type:complete len:203 (-) Transcript_5106:724-1332(-)